MTEHIEPDYRQGHEWIQTFTGRMFWALDPQPEDLHITDIAHGLSNMCRYNGHCSSFYSVAEHCVHLYKVAPAAHKFWALMHDASEAYICDIPGPFKHALTNYREIEERIMKVVAAKYGLPWPMPADVKMLDTRILMNEKATLFGPAPKPWRVNMEPLEGVQIQCWPPQTAKAQFLNAFSECIVS